jgi:hypothetical protein
VDFEREWFGNLDNFVAPIAARRFRRHCSCLPIRPMSRLGLYFCAPYALFIAACIACLTVGDIDYQGQSILLQLPIMLQLTLADALGLGQAASNIAWPDAWGLFITPAFLLLYAAGALIERGVQRRRALPSQLD